MTVPGLDECDSQNENAGHLSRDASIEIAIISRYTLTVNT